MTDLFNVVTMPIEALADMLFELVVGTSNVGSLVVVGFIFTVLILAIMHATMHGSWVGKIASKFKDKGKKNAG